MSHQSYEQAQDIDRVSIISTKKRPFFHQIGIDLAAL